MEILNRQFSHRPGMLLLVLPYQATPGLGARRIIFLSGTQLGYRSLIRPSFSRPIQSQQLSIIIITLFRPEPARLTSFTPSFGGPMACFSQPWIPELVLTSTRIRLVPFTNSHPST